MTDVLRIKRRALGGAAGAPASLAVGELAFNEQDGGLYIGRSNGSIIQVNIAGGGGGGTPAPQGRLTLQTATPVMTTTQAAKTAIFYSPYVGDEIRLYNGTTMVLTTFTELMVATTDTTKSPAAIGASKCNDWFVWNDAGTIRIGHGPDWTNDATRSAGTALVRVNGLWLNNASITNGPAAQRGTYVGTTRSNASSQLDWIFGTSAVNGGAALLNVWNAYNRVDVGTKVSDSTASWVYGTNAWRSANGSNNNSVSFVSGLAEDSPNCIYSIIVNGAAAGSLTGVGLDSTSAPSGNTAYVSLVGYQTPYAGNLTYGPQLGAHFFQALEWGTVNSWQGDGGSGGLFGAGLMFRLRM